MGQNWNKPELKLGKNWTRNGHYLKEIKHRYKWSKERTMVIQITFKCPFHMIWRAPKMI